MRLLIGCLISVLAIFSPGHAAKAAKPFLTVWRFVPITPEGTKTVTYRDPLIESRVIPVEMVEVKQPVVLTKGKWTLETGTLLYSVLTEDHTPCYCTFAQWADAKKGKSILRGLDDTPCFLDTDRDGSFDKAFFVRRDILSPVSPQANLKSAFAVDPAPYSQVDPLQYPFAGSVYDKTVTIYLRGFTVNLGKKGKLWWSYKFTDEMEANWNYEEKTTAAPGESTEAFNAIINVISVENEKITVDIKYQPELVFTQITGPYRSVIYSLGPRQRSAPPTAPREAPEDETVPPDISAPVQPLFEPSAAGTLETSPE